MANNLQEFRENLKAAIAKNPQAFFDHPSHNWKDYQGKLKGGSPHRESQTGESFWIDLNRMTWEDSGMVNDAGNKPHGDAIDYLQYIEDPNYVRASKEKFIHYAKKAAEKAGIPFPEITFKSDEDRETAYILKRRSQALDIVIEFSNLYLLTSQDSKAVAAREYLASRKVTTEIIKDFRLGLFDSDTVYMNLLGSGFDFDELECFDLFYKLQNGTSRFHGYLTTPWYETCGSVSNAYFRYPHPDPKSIGKDRIVSLGNPKKDGKTLYHTKSAPLGFFEALQTNQRNLTIIEGVYDWVLCKAFGDDSVISPVGTAISEGQIETLKRYKNQIDTLTIIYDNDKNKAGQNASITQCKKLLAEGFRVFIGKLPGEGDPAEYLQENSIDAWKEVANTAQNAYKALAQHVIQCFNESTETDKGVANLEKKAKECLGFLTSVPYDQRNVTDLDNFWDVLAPYGVKRQEIPYKEPVKPEEVKDNSNLIPQITRVLKEITDPAQKTIALEEIRLKTSYSFQAFSALVQTILQGLEAPEAAGELLSTIALQQVKLNVRDVLPKNLAIALEDAANATGVTPTHLLQFLLPAVASLIGSKATAKVCHNNPFEVYALLYSIIVDYSGFGKSRSQDLVCGPLYQKQEEIEKNHIEKRNARKELEKRWRLKTKEEQRDLIEMMSDEDPDHPSNNPGRRVKYVLDKGQMESILQRLSEQEDDKGVLWVKDEFSAILKGLDAYKSGGKGDARETILSLFDNKPISIELKDEEKSTYISKPNLSICGCITPKKAREVFSDTSDSDGFLARFLVAFPEMELGDNDFKWKEINYGTDLTAFLTTAYKDVEDLNLGQCMLSQSAYERWKEFYPQIRKIQYENREVDPALSALCGRMPTHVMRLALVLHHLSIVCAEYEKCEIIPEVTLGRAILLASYYMSQHRKLMSWGELEGQNSPTSILMQINEWAKARKGVDARTVAQSALGKKLRAQGKAVTRATIEELFVFLSEQGLGEFNGTVYKPYTSSSGKSLKIDVEKIPALAEVQTVASNVVGVELSFGTNEDKQDAPSDDDGGSKVVLDATPEPQPEPPKQIKTGDVVVFEDEVYQIVLIEDSVAKLQGCVDTSVIKQTAVSNLQAYCYDL